MPGPATHLLLSTSCKPAIRAVNGSKARPADRRRAMNHRRTRMLCAIAVALLGIGWSIAGVAQIVLLWYPVVPRDASFSIFFEN